MKHVLRSLVSLLLLFSTVFSNLPVLVARAAQGDRLPAPGASPLMPGRRTSSNFPLYAANFNSDHYVVSLDSGGSQVRLASGGFIESAFSAAADSHGNLYLGFSSSYGPFILMLDPTGIQNYITGMSGPPYGMTMDGSGTLFVSNGWGIFKLTPSGDLVGFASGEHLPNPTGLAFDSHGTLYVANQMSATNSVVKISPSGEQSVFTEGGYITNPWALAFDASDNLYVTEFNNTSQVSSIIKVSPAGVQSEFATGGSLSNPRGLAFDRNGDLYAGNYNGTAIVKITPAGEQTLFAADGYLHSPMALAFSKGNLAAVLNMSPLSSEFGQPVTITAVLTGTSGIPSGTLAFEDGGAAIPGCEAVALDGSGQARCTSAAFSTGTHALRSVYSGDNHYNHSTSAPYSFLVRQAATSTTLAVAPNPSIFGQPVTFTATVAAAPGVPTGTVTFFDNLLSLGSSALDAGGVATFTTSSLSAGIHPVITATYEGNTNNLASASGALSQIVIKAASTTTLTSAPNPSVFGQSVTLKATVTAAPGVPGGAVTFYDNGVGLARRTLNGGVATFTTSSLAAGAHPALTVSYQGDGRYLPSTSSAFTHTVDKIDVTISLASAPRPSTLGQMITFTTTVTAVPSSAVALTGAITLSIDTLTLVAPLGGGGQAIIMTDTLPTGSHIVTAAYPGDANFKAISGTLEGGQTVLDVPITGLSALNDSPTPVGTATGFLAAVLTGSHVQYAWDFGDGGTGAGEQVSHRYTLMGSYTATITATNTLGSLSVTTPVTIGPASLHLPLVVKSP